MATRFNSTGIWPGVAVIGLVCSLSIAVVPQRALASPITAFEIAEVMVDSQIANATLIARLFRPDTTSLVSFISETDTIAKTFLYLAAPGSSFLGSDLNLTVTGAFNDISMSWEMLSSGSLAGVSWTGSGVGRISPGPGGDVLGDFEWEWDISPLGISLDYQSDVIYAPVFDPISGDLVGFASRSRIAFTVNNEVVARARAIDTIELDDEGRRLETEWSLEDFEFLFLSFQSRGTIPFPDGGAGAFFVEVTPTPEPSAAALGLIALICSAAWRGRRRRKTVLARTSHVPQPDR